MKKLGDIWLIGTQLAKRLQVNKTGQATTLQEDGSIEFEMVCNTRADAGFMAIYHAFINSTPIELAVFNGGDATEGSQGLRGTVVIANLRYLPLAPLVTVSVTAKLVATERWEKVDDIRQNNTGAEAWQYESGMG